MHPPNPKPKRFLSTRLATLLPQKKSKPNAFTTTATANKLRRKPTLTLPIYNQFASGLAVIKEEAKPTLEANQRGTFSSSTSCSRISSAADGDKGGEDTPATSPCSSSVSLTHGALTQGLSMDEGKKTDEDEGDGSASLHSQHATEEEVMMAQAQPQAVLKVVLTSLVEGQEDGSRAQTDNDKEENEEDNAMKHDDKIEGEQKDVGIWSRAAYAMLLADREAAGFYY